MFECLEDGNNRTVHFLLGRVVGRQSIAKVKMASDAATGFGKDAASVSTCKTMSLACYRMTALGYVAA